MSSADSQNGNNNAPPTNDMSRNRRGSITSSAFTNLFQRSNSVSTGTPAVPGPITTAALNDQRRRLSVSTAGLPGTSPSTSLPIAFGLRRSSLSTSGSDSIDENAVEEDEPGSGNARTAPTTPFTRRMSFGAQAMRNMRTGGTSPGSNGRPTFPNNAVAAERRRSSVLGTIPAAGLSSGMSSASAVAPRGSQASSAHNPRSASDINSAAARSDQGFNWSEQLRSRAESTVAAGSRPSISWGTGLGSSPPRNGGGGGMPGPTQHDRARSVSEMPAPPAQAMKPKERPKPDAFQERILKGDFYMD